MGVKTNTIVRITLLVALAGLGIMAAVKSCDWIAENYFFDRFYYEKSIAHGYWVKPDMQWSDFGDRTRDIIALTDKTNVSGGQYASGVYSTNGNTFTIAIIGDSAMFGQGVRYPDTVAKLLEEILNRQRKTRVLNFSRSGDAAIDYFAKYLLSKSWNIDLYIFSLVTNDMLLSLSKPYPHEVYNKVLSDCARKYPEGSFIYEFNQTPNHVVGRNALPNQTSSYIMSLITAFESTRNQCIFREAVDGFPRTKAIYLDATYDETAGYVYKPFLDRIDMPILSIKEAMGWEKYSKYFNDPKKYFQVSEKEPHPSKLLHRIYADILAQQIMTNPTYGFYQKDQ